MNSPAPICLLIVCGLVHLSLSLPAEAADQFQVDEIALQPGKMGMNVETLSPRQAADAGDPGLKGVRITEVTSGGPADKLGLRQGDIIVQANDRPVLSHMEIAALMRDRLVGATTRLQVRRNADRRVVDVDIPSAPQPMLRIDADTHNAPIRRIALDGNGRWLVTASEDKTAKVWDLATGRLARSLRPPVGNDNEGKLAAVAMSPNGTIVAVAGWTGMWGKTASVYLFDRANGRLLRQLSGLPDMVEALAWSSDGNFLGVSLAGQGGVHVYRTDKWAVLGSDRNFGGRVTGLDFDRGNRLLSASYDGFLRIHSVGPDGLKLMTKRIGPGGKQPATARFSPDGKLIAVGYADSTQVSVLSGANLDVAYSPNTLSAKNGDLRSVAWSSDGNVLFAAGRFVVGARQVIRSWPDAGRGQPRDDPVAGNSIFDLQAMPGGGVVYGTAEPAWGILSANGQKLLGVSSPIADYRGGGEQLQVSRDGHRIRFSFERNGALAADFDTENGLVINDKGITAGSVAPPPTDVPGLVLSNWRNTSEPKLNSVTLRLRPGENSRSLAIAPDGLSVVLGSDWGWNKFDAAGKLLGRIVTPGAAWAVNFSGDGRLMVAAFADGTIRWYGARNGEEKLALFAHSDRKRWVAWTPSGYYAASPAGEELIGWHINNGPDQAGDFYPASRFRAKFYRPDVLSKVLEASTEIEALRLANLEAGRTLQHVDVAQSLPPMIDSVSPTEAKIANASVTIRFRLRNVTDAPLRNIRVRVNGGYLPEGNYLTVNQSGAGEERSLTVKLPEQDSTVELFAENRNGISTPATFRYFWQGTRPPKKPNLPTLYVLAIGISTYRDSSIRLGYPDKDAKDFVNALKLQRGRLYGDVQVVLLTNEQATRQAVLDNLATMKGRVKEDDVGVLFIAGHGINAKDGTYYFVPFDYDQKKMDSTGVVYSAIRGTLSEMRGRAMLFIDTCNSGNVLGKTNITSVINDLTAKENNVVVFASSTQNEESQESDDWNNGAFTKALVEGMRGGGDMFGKGKVMYTGLQAYLSMKVSELTKNTQHPVVLPGGIADFVVAIP